MKNRLFIFSFFLCLGISISLHANKWEDFFIKVDQTAEWLMERISNRPELLVVLTAEVEGPIAELTNITTISSSEIPNFPSTKVLGHDGKIIFGNFHGKDIVILKGRFHYYEGLSPLDVIFPYFVLQKMNVKALITINAVGGLREDLEIGDLVIVRDQINYLGKDPLRGIAMQKEKNQFTDMAKAYSKSFYKIAEKKAKELNMKLKKGVYLAISGPCYESKAEAKMIQSWGADTVGMSTIFEVCACKYLGIDVLAINCVTDIPGKKQDELTHEKVLEILKEIAPKTSNLINLCIEEILQDLTCNT